MTSVTAEISCRYQNSRLVWEAQNYDQDGIGSLFENIPPLALLRVVEISKGFMFKADPDQFSADRVKRVFSAFKAVLDARNLQRIAEQTQKVSDSDDWLDDELCKERFARATSKVSEAEEAFQKAQSETGIQCRSFSG